MHRYATRSARKLALALPLLLIAAGCDRQDASAPEASPTATPAATTSPGLDLGALIERENPARVLDFYAAALAAGEWATAARAWGESSGMTGEKLKSNSAARALSRWAFRAGRSMAARVRFSIRRR